MTKNETYNRDNLIFDIYYNYHCNKMTSLLLRRVDNFLSFLIIFLGGAVFADIKSSMWYGLIIAFSMALKQVFQFDNSSSNADSQSKGFLELMRDEPNISNEQELINRFKNLEKDDVQHLKSIQFAAMQRATIALKSNVSADSIVRLTRLQKIIAWLSGDLPEEDDYKSFINN